MTDKPSCKFCKQVFETKSVLFLHQTENGPDLCKKKYEKETLDDIGIPSTVTRINLLGILDMAKMFKF